MEAARSTLRATLTRSLRGGRTTFPRRARLQSSSFSSRPSHGSRLGSSHIVAGAAGGLAVGAAIYGLYLLTPSGAEEVHTKAATKPRDSKPVDDAGISYLKDLVYPYVTWIPGGRRFVDSIFNDIESLREKHRDEVNQIVKDAYMQFQDLSKLGFSLETASKAYIILVNLTKRLGDLAGSALNDILDSHPQAREKIGGSANYLREMGENYGPEAKRLVEETWQQAKEIMRDGVSANNLDQVRRLVEDKIKEVRKIGDAAWKKAMEEAKPYLDKNPKVKALIEDNVNALKQCNIQEVFEQVKKAVKTGDTSVLEEYVKQAKAKFGQAAGSFSVSEYVKMIPGGSSFLNKINQMRGIVEKSSDEGEKLVKETAKELKKAFEDKSDETKDASEKSKKDSK